ncbi:unnamed protein product [marine sediment metagenome]|uniref:Uncharacterized protein n=1 Tax=marine sediment metagenome TaxID=412755 RepID=X0VI53_9ZZZZ
MVFFQFYNAAEQKKKIWEISGELKKPYTLHPFLETGGFSTINLLKNNV